MRFHLLFVCSQDCFDYCGTEKGVTRTAGGKNYIGLKAPEMRFSRFVTCISVSVNIALTLCLQGVSLFLRKVQAAAIRTWNTASSLAASPITSRQCGVLAASCLLAAAPRSMRAWRADELLKSWSTCQSRLLEIRNGIRKSECDSPLSLLCISRLPTSLPISKYVFLSRRTEKKGSRIFISPNRK